MIRKLIIKNYRSFGVTSGSKVHEIEFSPLTILVGDNSSGKSNLLRALKFATTPELGRLSRTDFFIRKGKDKERKAGKIEVSIEAEIDGHIHIIKGHVPSSGV